MIFILTSGGFINFEKGDEAKGDLSAPSYFIANAYELYTCFITEKATY